MYLHISAELWTNIFILIWVQMRIWCHLVCSPSMYDGFDEDSQILPRLSGLVPFEADTKSCWAAVIKGYLKHELFFSILWNHARHMRHLILLGGRQEGLRHIDGSERGVKTEWEWANRVQLIGLEWSPKAKLKAFPFERKHRKVLFS